MKQYKEQNIASKWCSLIAHVSMISIESPKKSNRANYLICGDQAWAGISSPLHGDPCTVGWLSLFAPNQTQIINYNKKNHSAIQKPSIKELDEKCNSEIIHWSHLKRSAVLVFLPWVSAAKALDELGHLERWVMKQANLTSPALSTLLEDEEVTRKATLQNQAAIDFLCFTHGHGCEDFEGICCFNLSSKSETIHTSIQQMWKLIGNIKTETEDWLDNIFKG